MASPDQNSTAPPATAVTQTADAGSRLLLLFVPVVVAAAAGIIAAQAPARVRLLGLFPIGLGMLIGLLVEQFARTMKSRIGALELIVIGLATFAALVGSTWQTFRKEDTVKPDSSFHPIAMVVANQLQKTGEPGKAEAVPSQWQRFREYLARRVQMLGAWPSPWPELFWVGEVMVGTIASVGVAWRLGRQEAAA